MQYNVKEEWVTRIKNRTFPSFGMIKRIGSFISSLSINETTDLLLLSFSCFSFLRTRQSSLSCDTTCLFYLWDKTKRKGSRIYSQDSVTVQRVNNSLSKLSNTFYKSTLSPDSASDSENKSFSSVPVFVFIHRLIYLWVQRRKISWFLAKQFLCLPRLSVSQPRDISFLTSSFSLSSVLSSILRLE